MTYEASPPRSRFPRFVARLIVCVGAIIAIWLLAPTAANALEPSATPEDPLADAVDETADTAESTVTDVAGTVSDAVDETADTAEGTVTEVAGSVSDGVNETADTAESTVTEAVGRPTETADADRHAETVKKVASSVTGDIAGSARSATARIEDRADDPVSTLNGAGDAATDVARPLLDTAASDDLDGLSSLVASAGSVTALDATGPPIDGGDQLVEPGHRERIRTVRFRDDPAFAIRAPPLSPGPIAAPTFPDLGVARASSLEGPARAPAGSPALPAEALSPGPRSPGDGSSFNDFAAILAALLVALGLVRWSVREADLNHLLLFLRLAERPG